MIGADPAREIEAGLLRRLAAMVYESLIVAGLVASLVIFPHLILAAFAHRLASPAFLWTQLFVLLLVYFVWFWTRRGQTVAMRAWRIRLVAQDGRALRPAQALLRYLLCWPSLALAGVGIAWALVDRDRRFLHDRLAGTRLVVVETPPTLTA